MSSLENKVAFITGGGTGIGLSIAERFVQSGSRVVLFGRREEPLKSSSQKLGAAAKYITGDVTKSSDLKKALSFANEQYGRIDVLVNCAGVYLAKPLSETSDDEIDNVFGVNVLGLLQASREAIPYLSKSKGSIINISSAVVNAALPGHSVYSGTKAAVDHITRNLAAELGPIGIRVNCVAPGLTTTEMTKDAPKAMVDQMVSMTPLGRVGLPEDMAGPVVFLASEEARWVTGQVLGASGGLLL